MILGNLAHEWVPGFDPPTNLKNAIDSTYPADLATRALTLYRQSGADPLYGTPEEQWQEDIGFRCPGIAQLAWHSAAGNPAYEYQLDHAPPPTRSPNTHSRDVAYVFGNVDAPAYTPADHTLSDTLEQYWTNFAKTGDPNGPGLPKWPRFDPYSRAYLSFGDPGPVAKEALRRPFCDLWLDNLKRPPKK